MTNAIAFNIGDVFFGTGTFLKSLTNVGTLVSVLLSNAIVIAGVILLFFIIMAGLNLVTSGGEPQKLEQTKNMLTYAVIGFIVVLFSYLIVRVVELITGIRILS